MYNVNTVSQENFYALLAVKKFGEELSIESTAGLSLQKQRIFYTVGLKDKRKRTSFCCALLI